LISRNGKVGPTRVREETAVESVSAIARGNGALDVVLRGEIDFTNASEAIELIRDAIARQRPTSVRVEMGEVTFLDSSGIAVLVNAMRAAETAGATYRVEHPNRKVLDQLRITGLLEPFGIAET
jgi:anti-sigma B factor antagonist